LRWLDLNIKNETPQFYTASSPVIDFGTSIDEASHITRMVIAADGYGYALTNDGNHFIKFTTGKNPVITDLGNLIDNEKNNAVSIHNKCTSWGGDMLADAFGKLYVISANHHVFVIDINSRVSTHKGVITNLPNNFTTNAAAVNEAGEIVVGSANVFAGYYKLNLTDLKATPIEGSDKTYNASDLANGNLLFQKEADAAKQNALTTSALPVNTFGNSDQRVFPNPVISNNFNVIFDTQKAGNYYITLSDLSGRILQTEKVNMGKVQQTENVQLKSRAAKGMYFVTVVDEGKQLLFKEKIIIQ
ncbi:MAG: T9SS type A sorting domain-containing protein, partial [Ferruginibacter sp.]